MVQFVFVLVVFRAGVLGSDRCFISVVFVLDVLTPHVLSEWMVEV